jgi:hypothetical protein
MEEELRVALRNLRQAIDYYKSACDMGMVGPLDRRINNEGRRSELLTPAYFIMIFPV